MAASSSSVQRGVIALLVLGAAAICAGAVATFEFRFIDLDVYRWGGEVVDEASNLYAIRHPQLGMPFTYTPFAALLFEALVPIGLLTPVTWSVVSIAALLRASWLLARERGEWLAQQATAWPAFAIAALVIAAQPGTQTVRLGQVGFVLLWLACEDLLGARRRWSGALVGVATALKLTPGVFVLLELVVGRVRAALVSIVVVVVTIAGAWAFAPEESGRFWRHLGPDVTTVGPVTAADHWSINGTVWRIFGDGGNDAVWLALAVATMVGTTWLARAWWLGGAPLGAIGLVGLGSVLASPFSWSHHWVLTAPLWVALFVQASRSTRPRVVWGVLAAAYVLVLTATWWHVPHRSLELVLGERIGDAIALNSYLAVAAALLVLAWTLRPADR